MDFENETFSCVAHKICFFKDLLHVKSLISNAMVLRAYENFKRRFFEFMLDQTFDTEQMEEETFPLLLCAYDKLSIFG